MFRLDKSAFRVNTFASADNQVAYWRSRSAADRLRAAHFLIKQAWGIAPDAEVRLDRTTFRVRPRNMEANIFNEDFQDFIWALNRAEVDYLLIGGYAVILHGYNRTTGDMDIWVRETEENYHQLVAAFTEFSMPVFDMSLPRFLDPNFDVFTFGVPPVSIDVITQIKGISFDEAWRNAVWYDLGPDLSVRVIAYQNLLTAKRAAGRNRDLNDIEQLEKGGEP